MSNAFIADGTTIDYNLTWIGVFDFTGYNTSDFVVQAGYNEYDPVLIGGANNIIAGTEVSAVPVPAAAWLFGSGLIGLIGVARRKTT